MAFARLSSESCRSKPLTTSLWYLVNFDSKRVTRRSSSVLVLRGGKIARLIAQTSHQVVQHRLAPTTLLGKVGARVFHMPAGWIPKVDSRQLVHAFAFLRTNNTSNPPNAFTIPILASPVLHK